MGRNRIIDRRKPVREDIDVEYNIREFEFYLHFQEKPFQSLHFHCGKRQKVASLWHKKGTLVCSIICHRRCKILLCYEHEEREKRRKSVDFLRGWDFESRFYIIKFIIKLFFFTFHPLYLLARTFLSLFADAVASVRRDSSWKKQIKSFFLSFFKLLFSLQKNLAPAKFSLSSDKKYLLLAQNVQKLFRHSFLAQYTVFDIQTRWGCEICDDVTNRNRFPFCLVNQ